MKWRVGWHSNNDSGWLRVNIYAPDGCIYAYTTLYNLPPFCEDDMRRALADARTLIGYAHRLPGACPTTKAPWNINSELYYNWKYAFEADI